MQPDDSQSDTFQHTRDALPAGDAPAPAPLGGGFPSVLARLKGAAQERYEVRAVIGEGGMGQVLEAHDRDLGRLVALKRARASRPTDAQRARLLVEAQITGQLDHPGVVSVHDLGLAPDGSLYYTMKLVRGVTVREVIDDQEDPRSRKHLTLERRVRVVQQVAHALHYAHSKGVVHRDVKPENILVGPHGEVFLLDWGVATTFTEAVPAEVAVRPPSGTGVKDTAVVGTPAYMAPEQAWGDASPRTDVFSLCAVLFELVTGHHSLDDVPASAAEVLDHARRRAGEPRRCRSHTLGAPALRRICGRGLATDPAKRFESAAALEQALQGWLEGRAAVTCPTTFAVRVLRTWTRALEERPRLATAVTYLALSGGLLVVGLGALALSSG